VTVADDSHNHSSASGNFTVGGDLIATDILPPIDNTGVVGNASYTWNNGQFTNLGVDGTLNVRGAVDLADNDYIRLGLSDDFRMWHDGTNTYFRNYLHSAGSFYWQGEGTGGTNHNLISMHNDVTTPYVRLYYDSAVVLETVSGGVNIPGNIAISGTVDGRDVSVDGTKLDTIATNANNYSFPYTVSASASNSTVVQRHSSGYIYANYFNTSPNDIATGSITKIVAESGNDGFMRHATAPAVRSFLNVADGANNYSLPATPSVTSLNLADRITHTGDINTYFQFPGTTGEMRVVSNANEAQKWGRSGNTTYTQFGDSVDVRLGDGGDFEMKFNGTDTYFINRAHSGGDVIFMGEGSDGVNETAIRIDFSSAASSVALHYDNSQKLITNSTGVAISGSISYTSATINDNIYHNGDSDTYMGFHANDQWRVVTGGVERLEVNNDTMTVAATLSMNGHQIDMNNNDIVGVDQIIHEGDSNTYMQFHEADQWRVVTGGTERLEVNNSQITSTVPVHATSFHGDGSSLTGVSVGLADYPTKTTFTSSTTLSGLPASSGYILLSGGAGSGARTYYGPGGAYGEDGGDGGQGGIYFSNLSVLNGATLTIGAGGGGASYSQSNFNGITGGNSTLSWSGNTLTAYGGVGGQRWVAGKAAQGSAAMTSGSATVLVNAAFETAVENHFDGLLIAPSSVGGSVTSGHNFHMDPPLGSLSRETQSGVSYTVDPGQAGKFVYILA